MRQARLESVEEYAALCGRYLRKTSWSNNYLLPERAGQLIAESRMSYVAGAENCCFLVSEDSGCSRLYYVVNDMEEFTELPGAAVSEILFRTQAGEPTAEAGYLEGLGFRENLIRDQYALKVPEGRAVDVDYSADLTEAAEIAALFNAVFDKYSGDYISDKAIGELHDSRSFLVVRERGALQGAMHITLQGAVMWISHVAVFPEYRGRGVADALMAMCLTEARRLGTRRGMLWVQRRNAPALALYRKYGFMPTNKSTISYIKQ